jgi:hypothetical protein
LLGLEFRPKSVNKLQPSFIGTTSTSKLSSAEVPDIVKVLDTTGVGFTFRAPYGRLPSRPALLTAWRAARDILRRCVYGRLTPSLDDVARARRLCAPFTVVLLLTVPRLLSREERTVQPAAPSRSRGRFGVRSFGFADSLCGGPRIREGRGAHHVIRDDAQPDRVVHAIVAMVATAIEPMSALNTLIRLSQPTRHRCPDRTSVAVRTHAARKTSGPRWDSTTRRTPRGLVDRTCFHCTCFVPDTLVLRGL